MKLFYVIAYLLLVSSLLLGSLPAARASSEVLIFSIPTYGSTSIGLESSYISNTSSPAAAGQNFPMPAEYEGYRLTKCTWRLGRQGTPNGTLVAMFFQTNGTYNINARPLGYVPLAESDPIEMNTIGGSDYLINFSFPSKPAMTDDYYWILIAIKSNTTLLKASEGQYIAVYQRPNEVMIGDKCYNQASRWYVYDGNLIVYVYGEKYTPSISNTGTWIGVSLPYIYAAIGLWSLAMIIGVGVVLMQWQTLKAIDLVAVILLGIGILICLFISLAVMSGFLKL
jgi:hypothetical protein